MSFYRYSYGPGMAIYGWSPMVKALIIINSVVFVLKFVLEPVLDVSINHILGLVPALVTHRFFLWQLFTYMFLHGGFFHLLFNMFVLWMFGSEIEGMWGSRRFIQYYLVTGIGAGILTLLTSWNSPVPTIGASGAIYGILVAFAILFPNRLIYLYFLFPVKAKHLIIVFALIELWASQHYTESGIANFAHLGGMLVGYLYIRWQGDVQTFTEWVKGRFRRERMKIRVFGKKEKGWDGSGHGGGHDPREDEYIDQVLDKISREGIDSLTEEEKEILDRASRRYRRQG